MKVTTSKSKNSESFYITQSYIDSNGRSTSKRIRKLGTLKELTETLGTDRDGVMEWAREQRRTGNGRSTAAASDGCLMTSQWNCLKSGRKRTVSSIKTVPIRPRSCTKG